MLFHDTQKMEKVIAHLCVLHESGEGADSTFEDIFKAVVP
jgi:hypothetical protein